MLLRHLLVRPVTDHSHIFVTKQQYNPLWRHDVNRVWTSTFEDVDVAPDQRNITSHFARHWFTTYWSVHEDLNPELVAYMRGDKAGSTIDVGSIDAYIHTFYEDVEEVYRERIFKLFV